jgi:hypothetical protein
MRSQSVCARIEHMSCALQLVVLGRAAACFVHRVFLRVQRELALCGLGEVDVKLVAQSQEKKEDVGSFECDLFACVCRRARGLLEREPLEMLDELTDFSGERHRQILGIVELVPVALGREGGEAGAQLLESIGGMRHVDGFRKRWFCDCNC